MPTIKNYVYVLSIYVVVSVFVSRVGCILVRLRFGPFWTPVVPKERKKIRFSGLFFRFMCSAFGMASNDAVLLLLLLLLHVMAQMALAISDMYAMSCIPSPFCCKITTVYV